MPLKSWKDSYSQRQTYQTNITLKVSSLEQPFKFKPKNDAFEQTCNELNETLRSEDENCDELDETLRSEEGNYDDLDETQLFDVELSDDLDQTDSVNEEPNNSALLSGWIVPNDDNLINFQNAESFMDRMTEEQLKILIDYSAQEMSKLENVLLVKEKITVSGDLHGDYSVMKNIFERPYKSFVFLGDYVDRGLDGDKILVILLLLKYCCRMDITMLRGNHECRTTTHYYQFEEQVIAKYKSSTDIYNKFCIFFANLPLACFNSNFFMVHGGLIEDEQLIYEGNRKHETSYGEISKMFNVLWSDPVKSDQKWTTSKRSEDIKCFNASVSEEFCKRNQVKILRGHQIVNGFEWTHNELVGTITTLRTYDGKHRDGKVVDANGPTIVLRLV